MSCTAAVPLYIAALNLHCHSAAIYSRSKPVLPTVPLGLYARVREHYLYII